MKKIDVIIRPFELDEVKEAVCGLGIHGMTITEVKVHGEQGKYGGMFNSLEFIPRLKIEIAVPDSTFEKTIEMIKSIINKSSDGSGNIFVSRIDTAIRIRTFQKGEDAIT